MLRELIREELAQGARNDPTSSTSVGPYGHGQGGLFATSGVDPSIFSAILTPMPGLISELPVINAGLDDGPMFGGSDQAFYTTITGVTKGAAETFANQPTTKCGDGARAGLMKVCTLVKAYGRYRFSPNAPINIYDAGRRRDLADPMTLRLMNNPLMGNGFGVPTTERSEENWLYNEISRRLGELGVSTSRFMSQRVYVGSPSNNNGEARDIEGLDLQINTGNKVDAITKNVCTAMDSDIKDFNFNLVNGAGADIQQYAEMVLAYLTWKQVHQGLGSQWEGVIVMRPEAWEEISAVVSIRQYQAALLQAQSLGTNVRVNIDAATALAERNKMRDSLLWPLRGRSIKVILDDAIFEDTAITQSALKSGQYASKIYFVNTTVLGGSVPTAYWKYFDQANGNAQALEALVGGMSFTSDDGMFRWYVNFRNGCIDLTNDFSPSLIIRCPQLCGAIQHVAYAPLQHFASWDPDSSYFQNGGRTNGGIPQQFYTEWSTSTPVLVGNTNG